MPTIKLCPICEKEFPTSDIRQKTCSKICADTSRSQVQKYNPDFHIPTNTKSMQRILELIENPPPPTEALKRIMRGKDLPDPEDLPAPYAKRVHDMWAALTGRSDVKSRIA